MITRRGLLTGAAALAAAWALPDWEPRRKLWALGGVSDGWADTNWLQFTSGTITSLKSTDEGVVVSLDNGLRYVFNPKLLSVKVDPDKPEDRLRIKQIAFGPVGAQLEGPPYLVVDNKNFTGTSDSV